MDTFLKLRIVNAIANRKSLIFALMFFFIGISGQNAASQNEHAGRPRVHSPSTVKKLNISGTGAHILFAGDTSFGENYINANIKKSGFHVLNKKGYDYCLAKLDHLLDQADLVIANLETPVTNIDTSPLAETKRFVHHADIIKTPFALKKHNITVVSLANNHSLDYGIEGLHQTMNALDKNGIHSFGSGPDKKRASRPFKSDIFINGKSFHLAVISGFKYSKTYDSEYAFYAGESTGGVNGWTSEEAVQQVGNLKKSEPNAFIVAFPHWGKNYRWKTKSQTKLARALINAGADLIIGHGAHMMQEIDVYRNRWILYGLGNFMFNSPGRYEDKKVDPFSITSMLDIREKDGSFDLSLRLYPIVSDNLKTRYQPRRVNDAEFQKVRELLIQRSTDPVFMSKKLGKEKDSGGYFLTLKIN